MEGIFVVLHSALCTQHKCLRHVTLKSHTSHTSQVDRIPQRWFYTLSQNTLGFHHSHGTFALEVCGGEHGSCITAALAAGKRGIGLGRYKSGEMSWHRAVRAAAVLKALALALGLSHQRFLLYSALICRLLYGLLFFLYIYMMYNIVSIETRRLKRAGRRDGGLLNLQSIITPRSLAKLSSLISRAESRALATLTHSARPLARPARPLARLYGGKIIFYWLPLLYSLEEKLIKELLLENIALGEKRPSRVTPSERKKEKLR